MLVAGPMFDSSEEEGGSFVSLELRDGYPRMRINLGDGEATLSVSGRNADGQQRLPRLNDGKWHTVEIFKNALVSLENVLLLTRNLVCVSVCFM